ncbi:HdeD family acid-resistance protein [Allofournierella sp. CML151]|uniref:HdeD family acid-resistance protein n=1 Tax=Allofournierella sp. CML151 TaxID=2998082 RepID=UPI0022EB2035|nr:DUF308 domain-containing protein [Fournierella sp. CML151]
MKNFRKTFSISSVAFILVGLALLLWPDVSLRLVCGLFGLVILLKGVSSIYSFLKAEVRGFFSYFGWLFGAIAVALGIFLLIRPQTVVSVLPILVGLFVILDGVMRVQSAFELRAAGYDRWWSLLLLALVSVVLGAVMLWNPFGTVELLVMAIGVILMVEGVLNLAGSIWAAIQLKGLKKAARDMADQMQEILTDPAFDDTDIVEADWRDLDDKH